MSHNFKVGDKVKFELAGNPNYSKYNTLKHPRYDQYDDYGSSGAFEIAEVYDVGINYVSIRNDSNLTSGWICEKTCLDLLVLVNEEIKRKESIICQCDIVNLWNFGHNSDCLEKRR